MASLPYPLNEQNFMASLPYPLNEQNFMASLPYPLNEQNFMASLPYPLNEQNFMAEWVWQGCHTLLQIATHLKDNSEHGCLSVYFSAA